MKIATVPREGRRRGARGAGGPPSTHFVPPPSLLQARHLAGALRAERCRGSSAQILGRGCPGAPFTPCPMAQHSTALSGGHSGPPQSHDPPRSHDPLALGHAGAGQRGHRRGAVVWWRGTKGHCSQSCPPPRLRPRARCLAGRSGVASLPPKMLRALPLSPNCPHDTGRRSAPSWLWCPGPGWDPQGSSP